MSHRLGPTVREDDCRIADKYGKQVDMGIDHRPFTRTELSMFRHDWNDADRAPGRFTGRYACPVCGMKNTTQDGAVRCCAALRRQP